MEVEATDEDLIVFIKNVLQCRVLPVDYENLFDLVKQGPAHLKAYAESHYSDEKFLNFLLSHADTFCISPDGIVTLIGGTEYALPQGVDAVDSIACVSDESYFGDREEYVSDTEEDDEGSINSVGSAHHLLAKDSSSSAANDILSRIVKRDVVGSPKREISIYARTRECPCDDTSTSDSSQDYLSSETQSGDSTSTDSNSQSSFESCPEVGQNCHHSDNNCLFANTSSSSYSSCSES